MLLVNRRKFLTVENTHYYNNLIYFHCLFADQIPVMLT